MGILHQVILLKLQKMVFLRGILLLIICIVCFAFMWSTFIFLLYLVYNFSSIQWLRIGSLLRRHGYGNYLFSFDILKRTGITEVEIERKFYDLSWGPNFFLMIRNPSKARPLRIPTPVR